MKSKFHKWYQNVSIKNKLFFVMGIMALLIVIELFTLWFAVKTLSSVRAYVGGEGLWSKAQKDAGYYLQKYGHTHDEADYIRFKKFMEVPMGDAKARNELVKKNPNMEIAREGFIEGLNHPDDIEGMLWLFRNFSGIDYIGKAIKIWGEAEPLARQLQNIGERLHLQIVYSATSQKQINRTLREIDPINDRLTFLENDFSYTLGEGSRWLENLILKILLLIAITVEFTGLFLTISVSLTISKGINEVVTTSKNVADGNLASRAKVFATDEIGLLANSFNKMIDNLSILIAEKKVVEENLKKQKNILEEYTQKLEQSNKDLEQFAYVASHDLKEPLRTIGSYAQLIEKKYKSIVDNEGKEFLDFIVDGAKRMDVLIDDLLTYSRLNNGEPHLEWINVQDIIDIVLLSAKDGIETGKIKIEVGEMPKIYANKVNIVQLFQNLISNSVKFRAQQDPKISISFTEDQSYWTFSVKDNGIGIDPKYVDKIFVIFQRLHGRSEYSGTGIGLSTCKKIVEQHGGKIWVISELGKGATFNFTIRKKEA